MATKPQPADYCIGYPWQRWLAWRPVHTIDGDWRWLCYVERRVVVSPFNPEQHKGSGVYLEYRCC